MPFGRHIAVNIAANEPTELYTIQQVMSRLQVADETVYRYIRSGKLKAIRVGGLWRVSKEALEEFLNGGEKL